MYVPSYTLELRSYLFNVFISNVDWVLSKTIKFMAQDRFSIIPLPYNTALRNHMRIVFSRRRLGHLNNVSRDEDNIWDQIYIKQIYPDFYYENFYFKSDWRKWIFK